MLYELRTYRAMPGRLPDMLARFRDHTLAFWERHGVTQVGFWTVAVGESNRDLIYLLSWESMEARDRIWSTFQADPEWIAVRTASEQHGPIVENISNQFLEPTDFSLLR